MDFSSIVSKDKDGEEKKEILDGETGEVLERAKIVENHEMALTFPRAIAFDQLTLEEKAYVYAVHKAAEKILGDRLKAMNEAIKGQMSREKVVKAEWTDVRVVHDVPAEPEPVESLSIDKLAEAMGTDHMGLVEAGVAEAKMTVTLDSEKARRILKDEVIRAATITTTPAKRSDRIVVTPIGALKETLASIKRKALPQKPRKEAKE